MSTDADSIAIIGAGITGWSTAAELVRRGIFPKIIDTVPAGGFASTHNQSWVQSGALYLAKAAPDPATAEMCRQGYHHMMCHNSEVIQHEVPCYFLFHHLAQRNSFIEQCLEHDIPARAFPIEKINEPLLQNSDLRYAAILPDHPYNNTRLLQSLAGKACKRGAQFYPVSSLETLEMSKHGDGLLISLDSGQQIECRALILACGAMIPSILERLVPGQGGRFNLTSSPVLALRSDIPFAGSMLISPGEADGPNLVPFSTDDGKGVTVHIPDTDQPIADYRDHAHDPELLRAFAASLSNYYSGILSLAAEHTILAHLYYCQKLHLRENLDHNKFSRRPIFSSYALEPGAPKNIFILYPGKATGASILAEQCAEQLVQEIDGLDVNFRRSPTTAPPIAKQPYWDEAQYQLVVENGILHIRPRS